MFSSLGAENLQASVVGQEPEDHLYLQSLEWVCPEGPSSVVLLFVHRHSFTEDHYVEFSKHSQDRVIGTKGDIAHVST